MQPVDSMPMFRSFRFKLILFFVLLITSLQVTTFIAVYRATLTSVLTQIENQLVSTSHTFRRQLENRAENLAREAGILAADYGFRTAVATNDKPTILSALVSLNSRINGDRAMVISLANEIVTDTFNENSGGAKFPFSHLIEIADAEDRAVSIVVLNSNIYEFTVVPVLAPLPIAWIGIGQTMDDALASDLKEQSPFDLDISFGLLSDQSVLALKGSTFEPDLQKKLKEIDLKNMSMDSPREVRCGDDTYVSLIKPLGTTDRNTKIIALLQYSLDHAMEPYRALMLWFLGISLVSLLLALIVGIWIASGVTRPVRHLSHAARRIRTGEYDTPVPVSRMDEIGQLAEGFNHMMDGIKEREEKIYYQARHDALTDLPNRLSFALYLEEIIDQRKDSEHQFCVILIGVDRLAQINNTLGHEVGDMAVKSISERLSKVIRKSDTLARLASDVFILLVPSLGLDRSGEVLEALLDCFKDPVTVGNVSMDVSAHLGVSCYPIHGQEGKLLMQRADAAMYAASRSASASRYTVYDESKDPHTLNRLSLMGEMRTGMDRNEFELHYQPKISLKTRQITHVEALIRWNHPQNGFMPPDAFIPLAEQTGHIHLVTDFSLRTAMQQCSRWQKMVYPINVAVNLSARDLLSSKIIGKIASMLKEFKMDPDWLILEITEGAVMQDPEKALEMLETLNAMGIKLSIDDFGTGYSSMAYLKRLPIQEIKIDKSFVLELSTNHEDAVIVRSTVEMGHNLGLTVIAEGVEDDKAFDMLSDFGCDLAQGYFFSRPLPKAEFENWLFTSPWGLTERANAAERHG